MTTENAMLHAALSSSKCNPESHVRASTVEPANAMLHKCLSVIAVSSHSFNV